MAYDHAFADRVRGMLDGVPALAELRMFGGAAWTVGGNMAVGTLGEVLICRVGREAESLLDQPGADVFDLTGRVIKGWVTVDLSVLGGDEPLQMWLDRGVRFASSLPAKPGK